MGFRDPCPFETEIVLEGPFGRAHLQLWRLPACQRILRLFSPLKMDAGAWANVQKHGPTMDFGFLFCVCYCYTSGVSCTACCCKQNTCLRTCLHEHRMWYTCPDKHVREVFFFFRVILETPACWKLQNCFCPTQHQLPPASSNDGTD